MSPKHPRKLIAITLATEPRGYYYQLLESARRHQIELKVLGLGEPFPGYAFKLHVYREYLSALPANTICLLVDAYDVLLLSDGDEIISKFLSTGHSVVYSVEKPLPGVFNAFYHVQFNKLFPDLSADSAYKHLNSGMSIGYAGALVTVFTKILSMHGADSPCDQRLLTQLRLEHPGVFGLDEQREMFLNCWGSWRLTRYRGFKVEVDLEADGYTIDQEAGRIRHLQSGEYPCVLHAPGKGNIDDILKSLNYKTSKPAGTYSLTNYLTHKSYIFARVLVREKKFRVATLMFLVVGVLLIITLTNTMLYNKIACQFAILGKME